MLKHKETETSQVLRNRFEHANNNNNNSGVDVLIDGVNAMDTYTDGKDINGGRAVTDYLIDEPHSPNAIIRVKHQEQVNNETTVNNNIDIIVKPHEKQQQQKQQNSLSGNVICNNIIIGNTSEQSPKKSNLCVDYTKWNKFDPRDYGCESSESDNYNYNEVNNEVIGNNRCVSEKRDTAVGKEAALTDEIIIAKRKMAYKRKLRQAERKVKRSVEVLKKRVFFGIVVMVTFLILFLVLLLYFGLQ